MEKQSLMRAEECVVFEDILYIQINQYHVLDMILY
jgi:hypothetical protein